MTDDANKMWGGRFEAGPDAIMEAINASIGFDQRLARHDIEGSLAHAAMLAATGIITDSDAKAIREGLLTVLSEIETGTFRFQVALEDIHMNIESRLQELIGAPAGRLHTARSRNDQVATDLRLWVRDQCDAAIAGIRALQRALVDQAEAGADWVMPGFTHLQTAQPVTWGHHMMAYVEMLERDASRLADARTRMNECPLGACALAGTSFPIDRDATANALGFDRPMANSLDAVADRDFALEFLAASAIVAMHLSRLAEEGRVLVECAVPVRLAYGPLFDRLVDHAAEEEPGCSRTRAGKDRAHPRERRGSVHRHEGPRAGPIPRTFRKTRSRSSTLRIR